MNPAPEAVVEVPRRPCRWRRVRMLPCCRPSVASVLFWTSFIYLQQGIHQGDAYEEGLKHALRAGSFRPHDHDVAGRPDETEVERGWRNALLQLQMKGVDNSGSPFGFASPAYEREAQGEFEHPEDPEDRYLEVLDTLERLARHESPDVDWLNVRLEPHGGHMMNGRAVDIGPASFDLSVPDGFSQSASDESTSNGFLGGSMLQLGSLTAHGNTRLEALGQSHEEAVSDNEGRAKVGELGAQQQTNDAAVDQASAPSVNVASTEVPEYAHAADAAGIHLGDRELLDEAKNDFRVASIGSSLRSPAQFEFQYSFPGRTEESQEIVFVVLALPHGYTVEDNAGDLQLCSSTDPQMPPLKCSLRTSRRTDVTFVVVASADSERNLPLGRHSFRMTANLPEKITARGDPRDWWFATFRFHGGHAVTKHFEDTRLLARRRCIWSAWRQETPCSTTCGAGFEVWTRTLFTGPSGQECGGRMLKRKCQTDACSLSCQLQEWETVTDCTRTCGAKDGEAFKIRVRKVRMHSEGWGQSCSGLYPWNDALKTGWSDKLQAVVSLQSCESKFKKPCPAAMGCRVEELNARTIPDSFPWGVCPFPCGGFGKITSIVQVANGIHRWIGEKAFPDTFQIPCRADKQPLVTAKSCNTQACEDCSVYLERPEFGKATRAWIFFLPTLESDTLEITAPKGVTIISDPPSPEQIRVLRSGRISKLSRSLPLPDRAAKAAKAAFPKEKDALGTCLRMANSLGGIKTCKLGMSRHYQGLQRARIKVKTVIEPLGEHRHAPIYTVSSKRSARPHWVALPVILGRRHEMEDSGSFYLWLTGDNLPRDPEVFRCRLKTNLPIPQSCTLLYTPRNSEDCKGCSSSGGQRIEAYRRFVPPKHGGSCDVPSRLRNPEPTFTTAPCHLSCNHLPHGAVESTNFSESKGSAVQVGHQLSTVKQTTRFTLQRLSQHKTTYLNASTGRANNLDTTQATDGTAGGDGAADSGGKRPTNTKGDEAGINPAAPVGD